MCLGPILMCSKLIFSCYKRLQSMTAASGRKGLGLGVGHVEEGYVCTVFHAPVCIGSHRTPCSHEKFRKKHVKMVMKPQNFLRGALPRTPPWTHQELGGVVYRAQWATSLHDRGSAPTYQFTDLHRPLTLAGARRARPARSHSLFVPVAFHFPLQRSPPFGLRPAMRPEDWCSQRAMPHRDRQTCQTCPLPVLTARYSEAHIRFCFL